MEYKMTQQNKLILPLSLGPPKGKLAWRLTQGLHTTLPQGSWGL